MKKLFALFLFTALFGLCTAQDKTRQDNKFTEELMQDSCIYSSSGRTTYFILEPGYQEILKGMEGKDSVTLIITVLKETRRIRNVETRIVEERESVNGKVSEISRNYFAFCRQTSSIYYFGEDVDMYKDGKVVSHEGSWLAGSGGAREGLNMPCLILLGSRFYQEIAPGVAMDRIEIVSSDNTFNTPAGIFKNCLITLETTPLEPKDKEYKYYAPGIGIIKDEDLLLISYGYVK